MILSPRVKTRGENDPKTQIYLSTFVVRVTNKTQTMKKYIENTFPFLRTTEIISQPIIRPLTLFIPQESMVIWFCH